MSGKIVGLIPARGGSKGIPGKNIKPLAGKPLIAYSIEAALSAKGLDSVFVDTDDPGIARIAGNLGVQAPWLRPAELAADAAAVVDAVLYFTRRLKKERGLAVEVVALLQPTSPFRTSASIDAGLELFKTSGGDSVISVSPVRDHPHWTRRIDAAGILHDYIPGATDPACRQELPPAFVPDGSLFISTLENLQTRKSFYSPATRALRTPDSESLDIDNPRDWAFAEFLLNRR